MEDPRPDDVPVDSDEHVHLAALLLFFSANALRPATSRGSSSSSRSGTEPAMAVLIWRSERIALAGRDALGRGSRSAARPSGTSRPSSDVVENRRRVGEVRVDPAGEERRSRARVGRVDLDRDLRLAAASARVLFSAVESGVLRRRRLDGDALAAEARRASVMCDGLPFFTIRNAPTVTYGDEVDLLRCAPA